MSAKQRGKDLLIGAVAGSVLGAATALLFAPKSGRELRSDVAEQAQNVSDKTIQITETVSQKTQEIANTVSSQTSEWYEKAKDVAVNVAEGVRSWKQSRKAGLAVEEEEVAEAAEDLAIVSNVDR